MTNITESEIKIIYFGLIFMSLLGIFWYLYSENPASEYVQYSTSPETSSQNTSTSSSGGSSWISGLIDINRYIPSGFVDLSIVTAIFLTPVIIILIPTSVRFIKDLVTQWV